MRRAAFVAGFNSLNGNHMDFSLNDEQRAWQMKARKFAAEHIRPRSLKREQIADPKETWDWDLIRLGSEQGFRTLVVPKKYGGHEVDFVTQALVMAELARADSAISKAFSQNWKWSHLISSSCTEDQKERFLKPFVADHSFVIGSASTEPNSGSDNRYPPEGSKFGYRLKAEQQGNDWILNGEKCFIANGGIGKLFFVSARTDFSVPAREGMTVFLVPGDTPGFRFGKRFNKAGWRFYQNAELIFENARIPHANVVGKVNGGWQARTSDPSQFNDLELAANAVGVCDAANETALAFVKSRRQGGRPLADQQVVQLKLAEMQMLTEALRAYVMRTAWERDLACA
ncbi:MAG: acyl-CoA dehydrogenase, partial [Betaproteobacteria bacterium]|nr:acyl-CoA dehydrogenase [Betaproteobacteria bacterium]